MPLRIPNDSLPRDALQYCIAPTASQALFSAGAAKAFTTINPVNAAAFGIVWTITDYVLDKLMPDCSDESRMENAMIKHIITCFSSYPIAAAATNALGYSLSITEILALSAVTSAGMLGVGFIVYLTANLFFTSSQRELQNTLVDAGATLGNSFSAAIAGATGQCVIDDICRPSIQI